MALGVKNLPANAEDTGEADSTPEWGRSPGEERGNPLQYSGLEDHKNPTDRGTWWATAHEVSESDTTVVTSHAQRHKD